MIEEYCDLAAKHLSTAESLNAIHACRPGHPMGLTNKWKWRNACFALAQAKDFVPRHIADFFHRRAIEESVAP